MRPLCAQFHLRDLRTQKMEHFLYMEMKNVKIHKLT